ncbi:MAG: hypothetical protein IJ335_09215 [Lachnospiraceae bacterium]|nr:hypothetical protein [Lachnospiraceae bacterium]
MNRKENLLLRLFLMLFTISMSFVVLPGGVVNAYGLFGEVTASVAQEQEQAAEIGIKQQAHRQQVKGGNLFNPWFVLSMFVAWIVRRAHIRRLPREDTIVDLKVRMNP